MTTAIVFSPVLFFIGLVLLLAGMMVLFYFQHRLILKNAHQLDELKKQLALVKTLTLSQGKKILSVSGRVKAIDIHPLPPLPEPVVNKAYQQAAKMLAMGAEPEEIMDCCDLTRGEIQLIFQLNHPLKDNQPYH